MAADPDVAVAAPTPMAIHPDGARVRSDDPGATHPDPAAVPGIVSGDPNVLRARRSDDDFLRRSWRSFVDHDLAVRRGGRRTWNVNGAAFDAAAE